MYILDMHTDIFAHTSRYRSNGERNNIAKHHLAFLKQGGVGGLIMVLWISPEFTNDPVRRFKELLPLSLAEIGEAKDDITFVRSMSEADHARKEGRIFAFMGVEGASGFENGLETVQYVYDQGIRHIGLSWNEENQFATGVGSPNYNRGLTRLGRDVVSLMDELGMVIDLSHLNEKSIWEVLELSSNPLIATHSNCRSLCPAERNLTDQQIRAIAEKGGVIGMNAWGSFVRAEKPNVYHFVEHFDRVVNLAGIESLALGFDFCHYFKHDKLTPEPDRHIAEIEGLLDWRDIPSLFEILKRRGYSDDALEKIAHKNAERVLRDILKG